MALRLRRARGAGLRGHEIGRPGKRSRPDGAGQHLNRTSGEPLEGEAAAAAIRQGQRWTTTRAELARQPQFSAVSPDVGRLDLEALDELLHDDPDQALGLVATMTSAADRELRELSRAVAGRLMLDVARRGPEANRRIGRIVTTRWRATGGDVDVDASLDALVDATASRTAIDPDGLRQRNWSRPSTALCLLVDRSGSTTGQPLATNAVAAAAVAWRNPDDFSVVSFARQPIVVKPQRVHRAVDDIVDAVLALRGFGTTDLAAALDTARRQLGRSDARRRITVLLSDCRATEPGDAAGAAAGLDELVIIAPDADSDDARAFADRTGARLATIDGPSGVPAALAAVLH